MLADEHARTTSHDPTTTARTRRTTGRWSVEAPPAAPYGGGGDLCGARRPPSKRQAVIMPCKRGGSARSPESVPRPRRRIAARMPGDRRAHRACRPCARIGRYRLASVGGGFGTVLRRPGRAPQQARGGQGHSRGRPGGRSRARDPMPSPPRSPDVAVFDAARTTARPTLSELVRGDTLAKLGPTVRCRPRRDPHRALAPPTRWPTPTSAE